MHHNIYIITMDKNIKAIDLKKKLEDDEEVKKK